MDQLLNAANAMNVTVETVKTNNNKKQEETNMNDNLDGKYGEVMLEQEINDSLFDLVEGALKASKYANLPRFFDGKELVKSADMAMKPKMQVIDGMYGKYKDPEKEDFAAVAFVDEVTGVEQFCFVSREGKDFMRRLVDICKANKISMKTLIEKVGTVFFEQNVKMKKGHENEVKGVLEDGTNNWFYTYNFEINK